MKTTGLLHPGLLDAIAWLGHFDEFLVCDVGYPVPPGTTRIDLAYRPGVPPFLDVLEAVANEVTNQGAVIAAEASPDLAAEIERLPGPTEPLPHDDLKVRAAGARFVIRTGEFTPYAIVSAVPF